MSMAVTAPDAEAKTIGWRDPVGVPTQTKACVLLILKPSY